MRSLWTTIEKQLKRRVPPRAVLLVPGEFFFSQVVNIPEGMSSAEVDQFTEFSLESLAPFPSSNSLGGSFTIQIPAESSSTQLIWRDYGAPASRISIVPITSSQALPLPVIASHPALRSPLSAT